MRQAAFPVFGPGSGRLLVPTETFARAATRFPGLTGNDGRARSHLRGGILPGESWAQRAVKRNVWARSPVRNETLPAAIIPLNARTITFDTGNYSAWISVMRLSNRSFMGIIHSGSFFRAAKFHGGAWNCNGPCKYPAAAGISSIGLQIALHATRSPIALYDARLRI